MLGFGISAALRTRLRITVKGPPRTGYRLRRTLLADGGRFLALAGAEVIQLGSAGRAGLFNLDASDTRGINWEYAFDTFAVRNATDGEGRIQTAAFAADDDALENLDPLLIAFDYAGMHADAVPDRKVVVLGLLLLFLDQINNAVHSFLSSILSAEMAGFRRAVIFSQTRRKIKGKHRIADSADLNGFLGTKGAPARLPPQKRRGFSEIGVIRG